MNAYVYMLVQVGIQLVRYSIAQEGYRAVNGDCLWEQAGRWNERKTL